LVATSMGALPKKIRSGGLSASTTLRIAPRVAVGSPGLSAHDRLCASRTARRPGSPHCGSPTGHPVGRVSAGLNQRHVDAELRDLLRQGLREALVEVGGAVGDIELNRQDSVAESIDERV
jgi:hypothetical protein